MVKLHMGIWAGIAAGGVMVMLVLLPILGCMFSRSRKAKKALEEESAAEKGEVIYSAPAPVQAPAPTKPVNSIVQKPAVSVKHVTKLSEPGVNTRTSVATEEFDAKRAAYAADVDETVAMKEKK
ncbi:hypothetical protein SLS59_002749 [Nothophoma quercina]|uniref:Uncharacterized protein n=1 Tax=Nothophoma quercina TaxID=749835 RepID=A0ABR3RRJ4_9PLEO